jgi:hypothetical protein
MRNSIAVPADAVRYQTQWRPSGGLGVAWQPNKQPLFGFRALLNNDLEQRIDPSGVSEGLVRSYEYRLGGSVSGDSLVATFVLSYEALRRGH